MFLRRMLLKYWITYISIAVLTMLLMVPLYTQAYNSARIQQINDMDALLGSKFSALNGEYKAMNRILSNLQEDRNFVLISNWGDQSARITPYHYIQFHSSLIDALLPSDLILDAFVMFDKSDFVVSKRAQAVSRQDFYGNMFRYMDLPFETWEQLIWTEQVPLLPAAPARYFQAYNTHLLTFLFYVGATGQPNAVIAVIVEEQALEARLLTEDILKNGSLTLTDASGGTLLAYAAQDSEGPHTSFHYGDGTTGLHLTVHVHERVFQESTRGTRNTLILYIGIAAALSLLLSFAYTRNVYRPVKTFAEKMQREGLALPNESSFDKLLNVSLSGLFLKKQGLETALSEIRQKHRDHLLTNVVHNLPVSQRETDSYLGDLPVFGSTYHVLRFALHPSEGAELSLAEIGDIYQEISQALARAFEGYVPLAAQRGALIPANPQGMDALCKALESIAQAVGAAQPCAVVFAISRVLTGIDEASSGYTEATQVLRFSGIFEQPVLRMDQLSSLSSRYDIVVFQPELLIGQLALSDTRSLEAYIDTLLEQLTELHCARPRRGEQLYYNISDACMAALHKHGLDPLPIEEYNPEKDVRLLVQDLRALMMQVNAQIQESRSEGPSKRDGVLDYIKANFHNPDLSLAELAGVFYYSEGYIYQIVKKQTGLSYVDYVNALRMDCACTLLRSTNRTAAEVAQACGFHNLNTFYKAFKKKNGLTPKAYREQAAPASPQAP